MKLREKYNLLAVIIFWVGAVLSLGFLTLLKAAMAAVLLIFWGLVSIALSTWIGDRTFGK